MLDKIFQNLNPVQKEAVEHFDTPLLIIAGAGSGKTRVITHKIAYAIFTKKYYPSEIFAATFTNKAAAEMKFRVQKLLEETGYAPFNIGTFHSLCAKILRIDGDLIGVNKDFTIIDDNDQESVIRAILKSEDFFKIENLFRRDPKPSYVLSKISGYKIKLLSPEQAIAAATSPDDEGFGYMYKFYQQKLDANNSLDFDDLISKVIKLLKNDTGTLLKYQNRFKYILVDEYQDTNHQQFELVRLLAEKHQKICVVGDEDQSIYSWRGADIRNILEFKDKFDSVKIIKLEQNYRSTKNILDAANAVIANNNDRIGKNLTTVADKGSPVYIMKFDDETSEAAFVAQRAQTYHDLFGIPYSEMAVFCRTNGLTRSPETQLKLYGIPYRLIGAMKFYERSEVKDMLSYLRLLINQHNDLALIRIINKPRRGFGEKVVAKVSDYARENNLSVFEALTRLYEQNELSNSLYGKTEEFLKMFSSWRNMYHNGIDVMTIAKKVLEDTKYEKYLEGTAQDPLELASKLDNINEFLNSIAEHMNKYPQATLQDYLESITLVSSQDEMKDNVDAVTIMTIHCAKGLEFNVVFVIGVEEPLFPNSFAVSDTGKFEEERRLFYVAITRAKKKLYLSHTVTRFYKGERKWYNKSCFLREIPRGFTSANDNAEFKDVFKEQVSEESSKELDQIKTIEECRKTFPVGSRVEHTEFGQGTVVMHKTIVQKPVLRIYFDKGIERTIQDFSSLKIKNES